MGGFYKVTNVSGKQFCGEDLLVVARTSGMGPGFEHCSTIHYPCNGCIPLTVMFIHWC